MFDNNQEKYEKLRNAVQTNWPEIRDEEFSRTTGDLNSVVKLIVSKTGLKESQILNQLKLSMKEEEGPAVTEHPNGVVNSKEPESQEWNARETH